MNLIFLLSRSTCKKVLVPRSVPSTLADVMTTNAIPSTLKLEDIQGIADLTAKFLNLSIRPRAIIKDTRNGKAYTHKGWFSLPKWAWNRGDRYVTYYTIHEVCHFYAGGIDHGTLFKKVEDKALAYWGSYIKRNKVYPKQIFNGPCQNDPFDC